MQRHHHLLTAEEWVERVNDAGFQVVDARDYFPSSAVGLLELLHYEGWHNLLSKALTGRWVLFPWRPLYFIPEWVVAKYVGKKTSKGNTCILFEASKPES